MARGIRATAAALTAVLLAAGCSSSGSGGGTTSPTGGSAGTAGGTAGSSSVPGAVVRTTPAPWDRPADQQAQVALAGLTLTPQETLTVHYHAHLDVLLDAAAVPVPAGLGINVGPNGSAPEHGSPGIAALHTHEPDGVLHIEAPSQQTFTLGQAFDLWGVALAKDRVGAYTTAGRDVLAFVVDGKPVTGSPRDIVLREHQEIAVVITTPGHPAPTSAPSTYAFPPGE